MGQGITAYDGTTKDVGFGAGVRFNLNAQTGVMEIGNGEIITTDSNGVERFIINPNAAGGDVAAAYDASGNLLWDALGLVGVSQVLATNTGASGDIEGTFTSATQVQLPKTVTDFAVSGRAQNILIFGMVLGEVQYTSGDAGYVYYKLNCSNGVVSNRATVANINPGALGNLSRVLYLPGLAPGSYSTYWTAGIDGDAGTCPGFWYADWQLIVLQLGN